MTLSPNTPPTKEALRRTWISIKRRPALIGSGILVGAVGGGAIHPLIGNEILGAGLGFLFSLMLIVALRFPKHYQRALRGE